MPFYLILQPLHQEIGAGSKKACINFSVIPVLGAEENFSVQIQKLYFNFLLSFTLQTE